MPKFLISGLLLVGLLLPAMALDNESVRDLDLQTVIDLALKNNVQMQNAREDLTRAKAQRKEALAAAMPVVSAYGQISHSFSIASQPLSFPVPFGVIDAAGNPVPLTDAAGNPVPFTDPNGNPVPGMNLQMTGVQLVPVNLAFGNDNSMVYGLNLTQPLFEGRVIAAIRSANVYDDLAGAAAQVTRLKVIEQAKQAFYQALLAEKMVDVMVKSLQVMQQNKADVQALFAQGKTAEFDVIRADVQVANQTTRVSNARKMKQLAFAALKRNCGIELETAIKPSGDLQVNTFQDYDLTELEHKMLAAQPLLNQMEANSRLMKENILLAKAEFMPSVALTGSYQQMLPFNDGEYESAEFRESSSLALGVNWPLFNGLGSTARIQKAKADHRKAQYREEDIRESLRLELESIYLNIRESIRKIEAGRQGVKQAHKSVDMAQKLYQQGMASQLQVLDAQSASDQAELGLYQAYYEYNSARASLARALGEE